MEYAIQLLLPILGGLWLGNWLNQTYGIPSIWTLILAILGMMAGLGILYKRYALEQKNMPPPASRKSKPLKSDDETRVPLEDLDFLYKMEHESKPDKHTPDDSPPNDESLYDPHDR